MIEAIKELRVFLFLVTLFIVSITLIIVTGVQNGEANRAKCSEAKGVYIPSGKGDPAICLTGTNLKVVDLNK